MKHSFLLLSALILAACTQTPQQQAEENIKAYVSKSLNDPSSYEPLSFTPLDSSFTSLDDVEAYGIAKSDLENPERELLFISDPEERKAKETPSYMEHKKDSLTKVIQGMEATFKPSFKYLLCIHTFRAKNAFGAIITDEYLVRLRKDLTVISARK